MKSRWWDDRIELNAAFYYTEFDDLQVKHVLPRSAA